MITKAFMNGTIYKQYLINITLSINTITFVINFSRILHTEEQFHNAFHSNINFDFWYLIAALVKC